jgi:hypothetical protein
MKRHIISKSQGTIVVLTVLIAVTLGMTNPSTVLAVKPISEYVTLSLVECSDNTAQVDVVVYYYWVDKIGNETIAGWGEPSCVKGGGTMDIDGNLPYMFKPNKWVAWLPFWDPATQEVYCNVFFEGTNFPATVTYTCGSQTATVTIGTPRVFP